MNKDVYIRMDELQDKHWWFAARRNILTTLISTLKLGDNARILEAGCGTGGNLHMLSQFGEVTAFEHDDDALIMARQKGSYTLAQGTLPQKSPHYAEPFDLIVAFDVVEHIEEDIESLKTLRQSLRPDGSIVITVPAFPFLWSKHDETHHHFRRYTRKNLRTVLEEAGYNVAYMSYFNTMLFPVIAGIRTLKKIFGMTGSADDTMPTKAVNSILQKVFASERHWVGKVSMPFGVSLVAVAKASPYAG
ncbi:class I SAM-dependent methyltransferase [Robiginitomaculum antarcticum]|uniref:class I SAM-dependent methyltransferase n=1 Tax=Robiginitomaculum antarcticum TaxID=437507 RepID=UPI00036392C8|nr:class I SAM-dependent methyltransferase [Robiginitomaculum antarcticum]